MSPPSPSLLTSDSPRVLSPHPPKHLVAATFPSIPTAATEPTQPPSQNSQLPHTHPRLASPQFGFLQHLALSPDSLPASMLSSYHAGLLKFTGNTALRHTCGIAPKTDVCAHREMPAHRATTWMKTWSAAGVSIAHLCPSQVTSCSPHPFPEVTLRNSHVLSLLFFMFWPLRVTSLQNKVAFCLFCILFHWNPTADILLLTVHINTQSCGSHISTDIEHSRE